MNCTIALIISSQEIGVITYRCYSELIDVKEHSDSSTESSIDITKEGRLIGAIEFNIRARSMSIKSYHMITADR